jgi:multicomponent Na+:H+ antiporter subunit E
MPGRDVRVRLARLLPAAWLVLVWMLLWGTFSWANLLSGALVAVLVLRLFPLPHIAGSGRLRPLPALRFLGRFVLDLVRSSVQVAWQSVRPGPPVRSAIVAARLSDPSEFLLAMVVETLSLVPGSVVIDVDPAERTLYAHVLGAADDDAVVAFRAQVARIEADLVEAFGGGSRTVAAADGDAR